MFNFEKLEVWRRAVAWADAVYDATASFPSDERFGLTNQMRRASVSVSSNVVEGSGRSSRKDNARFAEIAYSSLMEVVLEAHVARRRKFLDQGTFREIYAEAEVIARMLSGLRRSLRD